MAVSTAFGADNRERVGLCDEVESTAPGQSTNPEGFRGRLVRCCERIEQILENHGGTVEKFIGAAVFSVFGVPVLHEEEALRPPARDALLAAAASA